MLEAGGQPGFAQEALAEVGAVDAQHLQRDMPIGGRIEAEIEHAHAALREALADLIAADPDGQGRHRAAGEPRAQRAARTAATRAAGCRGRLYSRVIGARALSLATAGKRGRVRRPNNRRASRTSSRIRAIAGASPALALLVAAVGGGARDRRRLRRRRRLPRDRAGAPAAVGRRPHQRRAICSGPSTCPTHAW